VTVDIAFTAEEQAFRDEVRSFAIQRLPATTRDKVLTGQHLTREEHVSWQKVLHARGWAAPAWPIEFGGPGWSAVQQHIFDEEMALAGAPRPIPFGLTMVAPVIMRFGNPAQQTRFLPRILAMDDWWCQGYSEPQSGSDLASLKTRAVRDGDHYVVNGQKTWTTLAQYADWIFCLVRTRTEGKPQAGISFLLVDMKTPGVTVHPIITLDGAHEVNEVWFEDVRVPGANLVGEENQGWTYAKFLLGHERTNIAGIGASKRELLRLKNLARVEMRDGRPLLENPVFAARIAQVEVDLMALEVTNLRVLSAGRASGDRARRDLGTVASILKIKGSEIQQAISELLMLAAGPYAAADVRDARRRDGGAGLVGSAHATPLAATYFNLRKTTIYGGANEIQRNLVAHAVLGPLGS
jgi:alkylation response protein AidB-like acyl-CoA dehydrogenase